MPGLGDGGSDGGAEPVTPISARERSAAWWLFLLLFSFYALSSGGHTYSSDEEGMLATTRSLVEHASPVVEFGPDNDHLLPTRLGRTGGRVVTTGIAQPVVAIPFYLAGSAVGATVADSYLTFAQRVLVGWTNPVLTAAGVALVFLIALRLGARPRPAAGLALVYGVGTMAWPHAKTFFSEPLTTTLTLLGVYFALRARDELRRSDMVLSGAAVAAAVLARGSAALFPPLVLAYLTYRAWALSKESGSAVTRMVARTWLAFLLGCVGPLVVLLASNWWRFGSAFDMGYRDIRLDYPWLEGVYGLFLSPGKSIFLYAPVVLVGMASVVAVPRRWWPEVGLLVGVGLSNALFFARFSSWHGDQSWGPRYLVVSLPFLLLPVAPLLGSLRWRRAVAVAGVAGLATSALGAVMYFNQYFAVAEDRLGSQFLRDGPAYHRALHFRPYWSPILGHARLLDDVVRNTIRRLDGHDRSIRPYPLTLEDRYAWYFRPPQADSWSYWIFPAKGPKKLLVFVPVLLGTGALGAVRLRQSLT